jgi:hypothetical protein
MIKRRIAKLFRIYFWSFWLLAIAAELCLFILLSYLNYSKDIDRTVSFGIEAVLMLITTFTGIFVPLRLNRNQKKEDDRRTLGFMLGLIWMELRKNEFVLEQIIANYRFPHFPSTIPFYRQLTLLLAKHNLTNQPLNRLSNSAYIASQNSGAVSTFDNDEIYNAVGQAYENLENVRLISFVNEENLKMKKSLIENVPEPLTPPEEEMYKSEVYDSLNKEYKEILYLKTMTRKAIDILDSKLDKLGINAEEEARNLEIIPDMPCVPSPLANQQVVP